MGGLIDNDLNNTKLFKHFKHAHYFIYKKIYITMYISYYTTQLKL